MNGQHAGLDPAAQAFILYHFSLLLDAELH
jgi:hypothetical protein